MQGGGGSLKLLFLLPLLIFAMCMLRIEANNRRQMLHHQRHHYHPEHCVSTMPLPTAAQEPVEPPLLPPMEEGRPMPAPEGGEPAVVLAPGYKMTPFHVHACGSPCMGSKDCYWPCMACCPNSTCCDL